MPSPVPGRRRALEAAAGLLTELEIDQERPIDVFDVVERLGLWLVFGPLNTFLGAVIPEGSGGVMITTQRRPAIQRYTAAHEIGHWELEHGRVAVDTDQEILGSSADETERLAQLFASYFLMPPPLVHATASQYGIGTGGGMSPTQAYLISRDMHVSYEAGLRQMNNLGIITGHKRESLLEVRPAEIKQELGHGRRPENSYADIWPIDARSTFEHHLDVMIDDEIVVALPENRTTGYRWLDDEANNRRARRRALPPPDPFATPEYAPPPARPVDHVIVAPEQVADEIELMLQTDPASAQDASSARLPIEGLQVRGPLPVVSDTYEPGWAKVSTEAAVQLRRHIAGIDAPLPTALQLALDGQSPSQPGPSARQGQAAPNDRNVPASGVLAPGIGAAGQRWITLQASVDGLQSYTMHYAAPYDPHSGQAMTFRVEANVEPLPQVQQRRILLDVPLDDDGDGSDRDHGDEPNDDARNET